MNRSQVEFLETQRQYPSLQSENTEWIRGLDRDMSPDIEDLASAILSCRGSVRLLSLLASRPQTANTLADLTHLLNESEDIVRRGLAVLADHGAIQEFTVAGKTFYALARDPSALARLSAFIGWRRQRIQHMRRLLQVLEADCRNEVWGE